MDILLDNYELCALETSLFIDDCLGAPALEGDVKKPSRLKEILSGLLTKIQSVFSSIGRAIKNLILSIQDKLSKFNKNHVAPPKEIALDVNTVRQSANNYAAAIQNYSKHIMATTNAAKANYKKINDVAISTQLHELNNAINRVQKNDEIGQMLTNLEQELREVSKKEEEFVSKSNKLREDHYETIGKYIDFSAFIQGTGQTLKAFGENCEEHVKFCVQYKRMLEESKRDDMFGRQMSTALNLYLQSASKAITAYRSFGTLSNVLMK